MTEWELAQALGEVDLRHLKSIKVFYKTEPLWRVIMKRSVKFAISCAVVLFMIAGFCLPHLIWDTAPGHQGPGAAGQSGAGGSSAGSSISSANSNASSSSPGVNYAALPELPEQDAEGAITVCYESNFDMVFPSALETIQEVKKANGEEPPQFRKIVLPSPDKEEERKEKLTQLRVEIMAGGGPDLFFTSIIYMDEFLFPVPEKAMEQGLFYPLDRLMEQAEYFTPEQLNPTVLAAGKTAGGQMILPLTYTYPLTVMDPALGDPQSWQDLLTLEDEKMLGTFYYLLYNEGFSCSLGNLADYREEKLLFTQEELAQQLRDARDLRAYQELVSSPYHSKIGSSFSKGQGSRGKEPVPLYNKDGGVTAVISNYAAINRNSEHILGSFDLLDFLLSDDIVSGRGVFLGEYVANALTGEPVEVRSCQNFYDVPFCGIPIKNGFLKENLTSMQSDTDLETVEKINSRINAVQLPSNVMNMVQEAFYEMESLLYQKKSLTDAQIDEIAEKYYSKIRMVLQE